MMKLLLDTHIWVWSLVDRKHLSQRVFKELADPSNELWLSPISAWELIELAQKKRITLDQDAEAWIAHKLSVTPLREAPITQEVALEIGRIRLPHRDPADHFLVATAKVFELTLVTADERLLKVRNIPVLSNR
jgi:PIN domain nuclease of toxin-antitoxin system